MNKAITANDLPRLASRAILAALMGLLAFLIASAPAGGPLSAVVEAQTASPTPSSTTINFLNPSETSSNEISARPDGTDSAYHIVAAVSQVPADATVVFQLVSANPARETTICIGSTNRVGTTDTWECFWDIGEIADGSYELRAVLFSGNQEIARDQDPVVINNQGARPTSTTPPGGAEGQGETVEITYPANGGSLGFYNPDPNATQRAILRGTASDETDSVTAYYSIAAPGAEPVYTSCGTATKANLESQGVPCTLVSPDQPSQVTAVALVASDAEEQFADPQGTFTKDSSDGHRVINAYRQVPTSLALAPQSQNQAVNVCTQPIIVTVLDQEQRAIARANVDVHAQGPTDNLFFDDTDSSGDQTSANKPPDMNHAGSPEAAANCESTTNPSSPGSTQQGQHENPDTVGSPADVKHIESIITGTTPGTNQNGQWNFALVSPNAGGTIFTVWADSDDDDQRCTNEASANGSVGWNVAAPTPETVTTGTEPTTCPSPSASPTPSETPSESPSASPSDDPSATPTDEPTGEPGEECPGYEGDPRNHVVGDEGDNQLDGTEGDDIICGLGGNDQIDGLGGDDLLLGGDGNDIILGGDGNDDIRGEDGKDDLRGNGGNDTINGGLMNDIILGNAGNDLMVGGGGDDILRGGDGADFGKGGGGKDTLQGGLGKDELRGSGGKDTIKGGAGADELRGGKGEDLLKGGTGNDKLYGGGGRDTCSGGRGNNQLRSCEL